MGVIDRTGNLITEKIQRLHVYCAINYIRVTEQTFFLIIPSREREREKKKERKYKITSTHIFDSIWNIDKTKLVHI